MKTLMILAVLALSGCATEAGLNDLVGKYNSQVNVVNSCWDEYDREKGLPIAQALTARDCRHLQRKLESVDDDIDAYKQEMADQAERARNAGALFSGALQVTGAALQGAYQANPTVHCTTTATGGGNSMTTCN